MIVLAVLSSLLATAASDPLGREWVEAQLACIPHPQGTCDRRPVNGDWNHVEGNMRWFRALHVERQGATIRAVVIRESRIGGGPATVWHYDFDEEGRVLSSTCIPNLPEEGAALKGLRGPDSLVDGRLRFQNHCTSYYLAVRDFIPKGEALGEALPLPPSGIGSKVERTPPGPIYLQGVPKQARESAVELDFAPLVLPLDRPFVKVSALSGTGWKAAPRVAELIHHLGSDVGYPPLFGEYVSDAPECRVRVPVLSPECRAAAQKRSDEVKTWVRWVRDQAEQGQAEILPIAEDEELTGHTVGLAPGGSMVLEVDGIPLLFEGRRSAGLRVVFDGETSVQTKWAALRERLRREAPHDR